MACLLENRGKRGDAVAYASRAVNARVDKENLHGLMNFPGLLEGVEPYYFLTARAVPLKARWFTGWFLGPSQDQTASFNGKLLGASTVAFSFAKKARRPRSSPFAAGRRSKFVRYRNDAEVRSKEHFLT